MASRPLRLLLAGLIGLSSLCAAAEESRYGRDTVSDIRYRIETQHCDGAVDDLKAGLKKGFVEVALLAGGMYDNGICVKRDWNRAVLFYVEAWQGGMKEAADGLAAGYAAPVDDIDRFVAELQTWPQARRGARVCDVWPGQRRQGARALEQVGGQLRERLARGGRPRPAPLSASGRHSFRYAGRDRWHFEIQYE